MPPVAWDVSENILVAKLHADFGCDIRELAQVLHYEHAPSGHLRQISQQSWAGALLRSWSAIGIEESDGVNLHIGFLDKSPDIGFRIPTMIIASVR